MSLGRMQGAMKWTPRFATTYAVVIEAITQPANMDTSVGKTDRHLISALYTFNLWSPSGISLTPEDSLREPCMADPYSIWWLVLGAQLTSVVEFSVSKTGSVLLQLGGWWTGCFLKVCRVESLYLEEVGIGLLDWGHHVPGVVLRD